MNIENIPGFEKTPENTNTIENCKKIWIMAGITIQGGMIIVDTDKIKKLLDDRRKLATALKSILKELYAEDKKYINEWINYLKSMKNKLEKITRRTWEELIKEIIMSDDLYQIELELEIDQLKAENKKQKQIIDWFAEQILSEWGCPLTDGRKGMRDFNLENCNNTPEEMYDCWIKYAEWQINKS